MHLANGFKLIYERVKDATRKLYASKTSLPEEEDAELDFGVPAEELQNIKLVYEKDGKIMISKTGIPGEDDIATTITADGEIVISDEDEPVPPEPTPLTPIHENDSSYSNAIFKVNTNMSVSEINSILSDIIKGGQEGTIQLATYDIVEHPGYLTYLQVGEFEDDKGNSIISIAFGSNDPLPLYYSDDCYSYDKDIEDYIKYDAGWQYTFDEETIIGENGTVDISEIMGPTPISLIVTDVNEDYSGWNGTLVGTVTE